MWGWRCSRPHRPPPRSHAPARSFLHPGLLTARRYLRPAAVVPDGGPRPRSARGWMYRCEPGRCSRLEVRAWGLGPRAWSARAWAHAEAKPVHPDDRDALSLPDRRLVLRLRRPHLALRVDHPLRIQIGPGHAAGAHQAFPAAADLRALRAHGGAHPEQEDRSRQP